MWTNSKSKIGHPIESLSCIWIVDFYVSFKTHSIASLDTNIEYTYRSVSLSVWIRKRSVCGGLDVCFTKDLSPLPYFSDCSYSEALDGTVFTRNPMGTLWNKKDLRTLEVAIVSHLCSKHLTCLCGMWRHRLVDVPRTSPDKDIGFITSKYCSYRSNPKAEITFSSNFPSRMVETTTTQYSFTYRWSRRW